MKATTYKIRRMSPGGAISWSEVNGYALEHFGLCLRGRGWWEVTHLPTGALLGTFGRRVDALSFCREVESLLDWSSNNLQLLVEAGEDVKARYLAIRRKYAGW